MEQEKSLEERALSFKQNTALFLLGAVISGISDAASPLNGDIELGHTLMEAIYPTAGVAFISKASGDSNRRTLQYSLPVYIGSVVGQGFVQASKYLF